MHYRKYAANVVNHSSNIDLVTVCSSNGDLLNTDEVCCTCRYGIGRVLTSVPVIVKCRVPVSWSHLEFCYISAIGTPFY